MNQFKRGQRVRVRPDRVEKALNGMAHRRGGPGQEPVYYGAGGFAFSNARTTFAEVGHVEQVGAERCLVVWDSHEPGVWLGAEDLEAAP